MGETWRELYEPHVAAIREVYRPGRSRVPRPGPRGRHRRARRSQRPLRRPPLLGDGVEVRAGAGRLPELHVDDGRSQHRLRHRRHVVAAAGNRAHVHGAGRAPARVLLLLRLRGRSAAPAGRRRRRLRAPAGSPSAASARNTKISPPLVGWWCEILQPRAGRADVPAQLRAVAGRQSARARAAVRRPGDRSGAAPAASARERGTRSSDRMPTWISRSIPIPTAAATPRRKRCGRACRSLRSRARGFPRRTARRLLHGAGCPELIARSSDEYIELAVSLAENPNRLVDYRGRLRSMTIEYGLGNADIFTPQFEEALIAMRTRCGFRLQAEGRDASTT